MPEQQLVPNGFAKNGVAQYYVNLVMHYGVNANKFKELWDAQDGRCAGCLGEFAHPARGSIGPPMGLKPELDHDHSKELGQPGFVRGLLCRRCNMLLGKLHDDAAYIKRLLAYLAAHGGAL